MKLKLLFSAFLALCCSTIMAQPPNDDIAGAIAVTTTQTFNGVNIQTATPSGVTSTGCSLGAVSTVWYSHTPTVDGSITGTILNPGPNTVPANGRFNILAWYVDGGGTGATIEERLVLAPGDTCTTGNSGTIATFTGTTYYAQVDNSLTTATDIEFVVGAAPPPNDLITGAIDINPSGNTTFTGVNTQNATGGSGGGMVSCNIGGTRTRVYYRFQPSADASVTTTITNASTTGDILMVWYESAVASATNDSDLTLASEDGCLTNANPTTVGPVSGRTINVLAGTTYYCLVQHAAGPADITFTVAPAITRPPNDRIENALQIPNPLPFTTQSIDFPNATGLSYGPTQGSNLGSLPRVYYKVEVVGAGTVTATIDNPSNNSDTFIIPFRSSVADATDDNQLTLADTEGGAFAFGDNQTINVTAGTSYYFLAQNGNPSTVTFTGNATLNINQVEAPSLILYPNPSNGIINVDHNELLQSYRIVNMLGQMVVSLDLSEPSSTLEIDITSLQSGNYFIQLTDVNGNQQNQRFIKE